MRRIALTNQSDEMHNLAGMASGFVLTNIDWSDRLIPRYEVNITNSSIFYNRVTPEQLQAWRNDDPLRTKSTVLVASIFEFLQDLRRSSYLWRWAIKTAEKAYTEGNSQGEEFLLYLIRFARIQLQLGQEEHAHGRKAFASNIRQFAEQQEYPPLSEVATLIRELDRHWSKYSFLVAIYALWRVGTNHRILSSCLAALEDHLKQSATFLEQSQLE